MSEPADNETVDAVVARLFTAADNRAVPNDVRRALRLVATEVIQARGGVGGGWAREVAAILSEV